MSQPHPQALWTDDFVLSGVVCSMRPQDTDTSRPGWSCNSEPGLADQKDTDRLMDIMDDPTDRGQHRTPRPAICPTCGLTADNGIACISEVTILVTHVCTNAHLFAVTWVEVS